ncbi:hypothetical protein YDYSY3_56210 [Paenibacillus chitinolyticus]|uniref:hypothetical protein n=1 Tax=Paenibacillus chitinolyticus TaxID=79263 RepID=UPI0026E4DDB2|nr:hypothetical protein [Paenibacillus chitinolyticus]GKS14621.1 hypothetical protein YDYSY3_56210 [Paenibacillus chitinolyticus]
MDVLQADTLNPIEKFSCLTDQRDNDAQLAEFILLGTVSPNWYTDKECWLNAGFIDCTNGDDYEHHPG